MAQLSTFYHQDLNRQMELQYTMYQQAIYQQLLGGNRFPINAQLTIKKPSPNIRKPISFNCWKKIVEADKEGVKLYYNGLPTRDRRYYSLHPKAEKLTILHNAFKKLNTWLAKR